MIKHYSVLLNESIENLHIDPNGIYVDATLGRGGHSLKILEKLTSGHLYAFDKDIQAINESRERLSNYLDKITFIHSDFCNLKQELAKLNVFQVNGFIMDLGVSSPQFDDPERGFSYRFDARLDMRMDQSQDLSAHDIVNNYSFQDLVRIFYKYGEENFSKQIARNIEKNRAIKPIDTTFELVEIIKDALPMKVKAKKGHPAKKVFQALRIEVNQELSSLEQGLNDLLSLLACGGYGCVITFHSLEDRIVKEMFNMLAKEDKVDKRIPIIPSDIKIKDYEIITRKPIIASERENNENNRSHSAKLRVIKRRGV